MVQEPLMICSRIKNLGFVFVFITQSGYPCTGVHGISAVTLGAGSCPYQVITVRPLLAVIFMPQVSSGYPLLVETSEDPR